VLDNTAENRKQARSLHGAGRLDAARAAYEAMLAAAPDDADLLGLLAALTAQQGQLEDAVEMLRRGLALEAEPRIDVRNLNNLGILLRATGSDAEACDLAVAKAPEWPEGPPAEAAERDAVLWLVETLAHVGETAKALRFLDRAMPSLSGPDPSDDAKALTLGGRLRLAQDDAAGAVKSLARAADLAPDDYRAPIALSHALSESGDLGAAHATAQRIAWTWPVYAAPPRPTQRATLLVFNRVPSIVRNPNANLRRLHFLGNYPSQIAVSMCDEYRFLSLFANLPDEALSGRVLRERLPAADLVLNNIANPEEMNAPGQTDLVRARLESIGLPVINHPDQVFQTTRQKNAALLAGTPNLKVPRIKLYRSDVASAEEIVADIGQHFDYPVILRKPKAQQSSDSLLHEDRKSAVLVADQAALRGHLERFKWDEFYAVEFVDLKRDDGFYPVLRAVFVGDEIVVTKPAIFSEWMVSGWRSKPIGIAFYRENPQTIEECSRIVRDPEAELGAAAMATLQAIRERMPLDMFGVDFDVDRDGRVVFFEAGASMNFQPVNLRDEPLDVRMPPEPTMRIDDAFRNLVARKIAEGSGRSK